MKKNRPAQGKECENGARGKQPVRKDMTKINKIDIGVTPV